MSYILEALADSEQVRQQIAAAPRYSLLPVMGEDMAQRRRWPYVLAGALLLVNAAVVLQALLRPALPDGVAPVKTSTLPRLAEPQLIHKQGMAPPAPGEKSATDVAAATQREISPPPAEPEKANAGPIAGSPGPAAPDSRTAPPDTSHDSAPVKRAPPPVRKAKAKHTANAATTVAVKQTPTDNPAPASPTPAGGKAELLPELPKGLPDLTVAGFIHDEVSGSMVIVNDRLMREGDEISPGLTLEKISADGLVFNYKGRRFKR